MERTNTTGQTKDIIIHIEIERVEGYPNISCLVTYYMFPVMSKQGKCKRCIFPCHTTQVYLSSNMNETTQENQHDHTNNCASAKAI
jgi:hypothetical protein